MKVWNFVEFLYALQYVRMCVCALYMTACVCVREKTDYENL